MVQPSTVPQSPPPIIQELVDRFHRNVESYRTQGYNETQLRREFLDPFFEGLGWDVSNRSGHAEAYKDVIHEDAIKIGGATKAPDYCFRIGGIRKFFLEAKKPSVNVKDDMSPAYQLRRYAWSARLPLSILTDFEEFAVYDSRTKPRPTDKAGSGRILYLTYQDYATRWNDIAGIFSKEAILKGSFDKYAVSDRKRGTATVDKEFLSEIEGWRDTLARHLALRNSALTVQDLNFAVQRTIDRLIFLRICEDRGVEIYGQLQALLKGEEVYHRLCALYSQADDRYNSGLFHFQKEKGRSEEPDTLSPNLLIDDKILKDIIRRLYYPESPYEFSVFPAEILGQVYEQFLGKVIRLTGSHQAKIEAKPEVKKAGGVYYTPAYIVDYIVKQTVGVLCEGKTPKQLAKLRILDPACGSGSFLIGAYAYLLTYHRDWYAAHDPTKHRKEVYQGQSGEWKLTTNEKKRILVNNIYGVDIDGQAVEVTKLSLLLKVLEGENGETLKSQLSFVGERALPDLGNNIKCGNSLIGTDYFTNTLLPDEEEWRRINPFDWQTEFPEIMKIGGFDAVIGNPPYVRQESFFELKSYLKGQYDAFDSVADLFAYFLEKGAKLLREHGRLSFIVSSSFLRTTYAEPLRRFLKNQIAVSRIVDFGGLPIFENAKDTYVCIPLLVKSKQTGLVEICRVHSLEFGNLNDYVEKNNFTIPSERLSPASWSLKTDKEAGVFHKIMKMGRPLGDYLNGKMYYGIKTGLNAAFEISEEIQKSITFDNPQSGKIVKPFLGGKEIRRYEIEGEKRFLILIPSGWTKFQMAKNEVQPHSEKEAWNWLQQEHPKISQHLEPFAVACQKRQDQGEYWWELRSCDYYEYFEQTKIIFPDICKGPRFFLDRSGVYLGNTGYILGVDDPYLLGILNSRLFWFAISHISIPFGVRAGEYRYRLIYQYMEKVPIKELQVGNESDQTKGRRLRELVEQMLVLNEKHSLASAPHDQIRLQRQIDATDREIDRLVYDLYELTDEEIAIVEGMAVASSEEACDNDVHERANPTQPGSARDQTAPVASSAQYAREGGSGPSAGAQGTGDPVHGIREPTPHYGSSGSASGDSPEELGSTRYFTTSQGVLSYSQLGERLGVNLAGLLERLLHIPPGELEFAAS